MEEVVVVSCRLVVKRDEDPSLISSCVFDFLRGQKNIDCLILFCYACVHTLLLNWTALVICTREGRLESSGHVILIFYIGRLVIVGGREEVVLQLFLLTCQTVVVVLFSSYFFFPEKS